MLHSHLLISFDFDILNCSINLSFSIRCDFIRLIHRRCCCCSFGVNVELNWFEIDVFQFTRFTEDRFWNGNQKSFVVDLTLCSPGTWIVFGINNFIAFLIIIMKKYKWMDKRWQKAFFSQRHLLSFERSDYSWYERKVRVAIENHLFIINIT